MYNSKPRVYYATPIRGRMGKKASLQYMAENCARAKHNISVLTAMYPEIEWISVAPFDRIVQKLLDRKQVKIEDILQADFEVGDECDGLLAHLWEPSGGADQEFDRQRARGKVCSRLRPREWQIWLMTDMRVLGNFVGRLLNQGLLRSGTEVFNEDDYCEKSDPEVKNPAERSN